MFTIHTAKLGEAWHALHPSKRQFCALMTLGLFSLPVNN